MRKWIAALFSRLWLVLGIPVIAAAQTPPKTVAPSSIRPLLIVGDSNPPNVYFTPTNGYVDTSSTSAQVNVTITFGDACELPQPPSGPMAITVNGVSVQSAFTYTGGGQSATCSGVSATATGTITMQLGLADTLYAEIENGGGQVGSGTAIYTYQPNYHAPPRHQLQVQVAAGAMTAAPGSTASVAYTVTNLGNTTDSVNVKNLCYGYGLVTHCYSIPDSIQGLAPGAVLSGTAYVTVSDSVGQMGRLQTIAFERTHSSVTDTAYTDITVQNPLGPGVVINTVTPDVTRPRNKCLTIEIEPGVAYECGDLRVVHNLPSTRTYNKLRTPALVYNSNSAVGVYAIGALVTLNPSMGTPDTVTATITDSATGAVIGSNTWPGSYWVNGATQRVTVRANQIGNESGARWAYTFTATAIYSDTTVSYSATSAQISTAQATAPNYMWMVAGQESLVIPQWLGATPWNSTQPLYWQNSEGDTRQYNPVPGDSLVWASVGVDRPDTIKSFNGPTLYGLYRYAEHGAVVHFDAHGPEDGVTDQLGHQTLIVDTAITGITNAISIVIPSPSGGLAYTFARGTAGSPLDSVIAPAANSAQPRTVHFHYDPLVLYADTIIDPDGSFVVYRFLNGQPHLPGYDLMLSYQDKRGTITAFYYDSAYKLIKAVIDTGAGHLNLTWTFLPAESRGYTTPIAPDSAYTLVTGPRANAGDSADVTRYWVDQWGEPTRIRDAHGYETELTRANPTYPALVTYARFQNGRVEVSTYDARGNPATLTDSSTVVGGVAATTSWLFNGVWDFDTLTTLPAGEQTHDSLSATNGTRLWQQVGSSATRRVTFGYNSYGLVTSVTQPLSPAATITYDGTLGNDSTAATPIGFTDSTFRDAIGRDTLDVSPNDSAQTQFMIVHKQYDAMDRVINTISSAQQPAAESSYVHNHYTPDGLVDSVERWSGPDLASIGHIRTGTQYDAAARAIIHIAQDGLADTAYLNAAGGDTAFHTRRGYVMRSTFDAMDRMVLKISPPVVYAQDTSGSSISGTDTTYSFTPQYPNCNSTEYCIPGDTATYGYDPVGNQIVALNGNAWVRRQYNDNGTLATDSLWIRTVTALDSGGNFTSHVYGLSYTYDLDGRRASLSYPSQLVSGAAQWTINYAYDPATGLIESVTDLGGNTYSYTYDAAQRLWVTRYPGTITDSLTYDGDSRVIARTEQAYYGSSPPSLAYTGALRTETSHFDARGKVVQFATTKQEVGSDTFDSDTTTNYYSGLGYVDSTLSSCYWGVSGCKVVTERFLHDGLGHQAYHVTLTSYTPAGASPWDALVDDSVSYTYQPNTDRVLTMPDTCTMIRVASATSISANRSLLRASRIRSACSMMGRAINPWNNRDSTSDTTTTPGKAIG
jgi:hypothetical protein